MTPGRTGATLSYDRLYPANVRAQGGKIISPVYCLERAQFLPRPLREVFAFFAEAQNLERLTPEFLHFRILTPLPLVMGPGALLDYHLQLFRIPFHWRTRIETYEPPWRFTDVQLMGPYRLWHHLHTFVEVPGGTLALDRIDYALPYGPLGAIVHGLCVRRILARIFDYRCQQLQSLFPPAPNTKIVAS